MGIFKSVKRAVLWHVRARNSFEAGEYIEAKQCALASIAAVIDVYERDVEPVAVQAQLLIEELESLRLESEDLFRQAAEQVEVQKSLNKEKGD